MIDEFVASEAEAAVLGRRRCGIRLAYATERASRRILVLALCVGVCVIVGVDDIKRVNEHERVDLRIHAHARACTHMHTHEHTHTHTVSHRTHEPAAPVKPGGHSSAQALAMLLPAGDSLPAGQEAQVDSLTCASLSPYLPGTQRRQTL